MLLSEDSPLLLDDDDYLEHYGVLGMKWGVRRAERKSAKNEKYRKRIETKERRSQKIRNAANTVNRTLDRWNTYIPDRLNKRNQAKSKSYSAQAKRSRNELDATRNAAKSAKYQSRYSYFNKNFNYMDRIRQYGQTSNLLNYISEAYAHGADKARYKIAKNEFYIATMRKKANEFTQENKELGRELVKRMDKLQTSYSKLNRKRK